MACVLLERLEKMVSVQTIELTCYENDDNILGLLKENLHTCQANSEKDIQIHIITDNYIASQYLDFNHMLGGNPEPKKYDFVIFPKSEELSEIQSCYFTSKEKFSPLRISADACHLH